MDRTAVAQAISLRACDMRKTRESTKVGPRNTLTVVVIRFPFICEHTAGRCNEQ